jgi:hypothetical protein
VAVDLAKIKATGEALQVITPAWHPACADNASSTWTTAGERDILLRRA